MKTQRYPITIILIICLLVFTFLTSLAIGRYHVQLFDTVRILLSKFLPITTDWETMAESVVMSLRLPRSVAAVIIGAALALSGATYQSIFQNPMCSPDLLGVSSGACVGAAVAILCNGGSGTIQLAAFAAGIGAVGLTMLIPRLMRSESSVVLILSGVVISAFMSSIMSALKYIADADTKLAEITYWTMGSFANVKLTEMVPVLPTILIPMAILILMRYRLNVMSLGDNEARTLGVNLKRTRGVFIVCATLLTASSVCVAGTVGWVGLIIPHISRMLTGSDNKRMIPAAALIGAVFMLFVDILCRTLTVAELKLGILTGIIGAPFFIAILVKQHRGKR